MSTYHVLRDDTTGAESWVRLPAARAACHRCHQPSASWYCPACHRAKARAEWLAILIVGIPVGLVLIGLAVAMLLGVAS